MGWLTALVICLPLLADDEASNRPIVAADEYGALAFHFDGKTVREYSTLDIAGKRDNVSASVSHYTVIEEVLGCRWVRSNEYVFELSTTDGRTLTFDVVTGERLN